MKKSDIIEIAVKILGLYLFMMVLKSIVESTATILYLNSFLDGSYVSASEKTIIVLMSILGLLLQCSFAILLTFGSATVTRKICRADDFSNDAKLIAGKNTLIEIAIIIIGGFMFTYALPAFAQGLYSYVLNVQQDIPVADMDKSFLYTSFANIVIGIALVFYSKALSSMLSKVKTETQAE